MLGYPSTVSLGTWYNEFNDQGNFKESYSRKSKYKDAVKALLLRNKPAKEILADIGVDKQTLYNPKNHQKEEIR